LSLALGISISLRRELLERLGIGGFLHDIGKVLIPDSILSKPGKLSREELAVIQQHPISGARILRNAPEMPENAAIVAFEHHINYDLSGYPSLVRRRPLSVYSMTVRIADYYDAMTALRPYRKPMMPADVLKSMPALSGRDFEPRLLSQFVKVLGTYPVGSLVRLDTNELAIVYSVNSEDPERPIVKLIAANKDRRLIPGEVVDLREKSPGTEQYQRSVVQVLNPISKGIDMMDFL
jgi:HD-GYP domain-containing protein (c-di-GMP phosphodiesterase class II)